MSMKEFLREKVPAYNIVEARLKAQWPSVSIVATAKDSGTARYCFRLSGVGGKSADLLIGQGELDDLRQNTAGPGNQYTRELFKKLDSRIQEIVIEHKAARLTEELLRCMLLRFVARDASISHPAHKWNSIGRGTQGDFERWLKSDLDIEEKAFLVYAWDDLVRLRYLISTGTDQAEPENWVFATDAGKSAFQDDDTFIAYQKAERAQAQALGISVRGGLPTALDADERAEREIDLDSVAGIPTRKEYQARLPKLIEAANENCPISFIMIDLDHFKRFNDTYGHPVGDKVLEMAGTTIRAVVTGKGEAYRYGGEEISVLLPNHNIEEAAPIAERIRKAIESMNVPGTNGAKITASLGVSTFPKPASDMDKLVEQADSALYEAKENGRNVVSVNRSGRIRSQK
jgi:diguanylate cyclase (GGDEF)-like protein